MVSQFSILQIAIVQIRHSFNEEWVYPDSRRKSQWRSALRWFHGAGIQNLLVRSMVRMGLFLHGVIGSKPVREHYVNLSEEECDEGN